MRFSTHWGRPMPPCTFTSTTAYGKARDSTAPTGAASLRHHAPPCTAAVSCMIGTPIEFVQVAVGVAREHSCFLATSNQSRHEPNRRRWACCRRNGQQRVLCNSECKQAQKVGGACKKYMWRRKRCTLQRTTCVQRPREPLQMHYARAESSASMSKVERQ